MDMSRSNTVNQPPTTWLPIGKASSLLGVNESTLRHWADNNAVRTYRTSGGHRRFAQEDLHQLMERSGWSGDSKGISELKDIALTRIRRRLSRSQTLPGRWHGLMTDEEKLKLRHLGRRLLDLVSEYLTKRRGRARLLKEARGVGEEYGAQAASYDLAMEDALEAFLFFRNSLDHISTNVTQDQNLKPQQALDIWREMNAFMDQVLLATIRAYQSANSEQVALEASG